MESPTSTTPTPQGEKGRLGFILLAFSIFAIVVFGLIWLFAYSPTSPVGGGWFLFSFAAGLSMIVLPCTLPLAFVIVPLSMGKGYRKGLLIALAFGVGVTLMLSMYGLITAIVGKLAIDSLGLQIETVKNWLYVVAGVFVIVFALTEIGLTKWRLPSYMGAAPGFISRQGDYAKALMLGLFLGNVGIGCPSPATYVLLSRIATADDVFYGWLLFLVHGIGRVTPLIFLALLGIIGINATKYILQHKDRVERGMGWVLVFVGGFILALGLFGHDWYVYSGIHVLFERITFESYFNSILEGRLQVSTPHVHGVPTGPYLQWGSWVMVGVWALVLLWYLFDQGKKAMAEPESVRAGAVRAWKIRRRYYISLILLLVVVFGWALPHNFTQHWGMEMEDAMQAPPTNVSLLSSDTIEPGVATSLSFRLTNPDGSPVTDLVLDHERLAHVIIVNKDFSTFTHIHPEDFNPLYEEDRNNAVYTVNYTFPRAGMYYALVGFSRGASHVNSLLPIGVAPDTAPAFTLMKNFAREDVFKGYAVTLRAPETILSGEPTKLRYTIMKDSVLVSDLMPYLAAPMHVALFNIDFSYYDHIHGEVPGFAHKQAPPPQFGPYIDAEIVFPWPGVYTIFGEFAHNGVVIPTKFMVEVGLGQGTKNLLMQGGHGH